MKNTRDESCIQGLHDLCHYLEKKIKMDSVLEIGSNKGGSAVIFAQYFKEVICIDPWQGGTEKSFEEFLKNTEQFKNIRYIRTTSEKVVSKFKDKSLSFVYIDGRHKYENVKQDLQLWTPKAIMIGGHDYKLPRFAEVVRAVKEVVKSPVAIFKDTSWVVID